jgi:hypothetical protein
MSGAQATREEEMLGENQTVYSFANRAFLLQSTLPLTRMKNPCKKSGPAVWEFEGKETTVDG